MSCVVTWTAGVPTPSRCSSPPYSLSSLPKGCPNQAVEEGDSRETVEKTGKKILHFLGVRTADFRGDSIMALSDDFKAQLKAGNISEALALVLGEAVELKFTTWVPLEDEVETSEAKPGHRLRTRINMIEGEVEHEIGEEFIGNGRYRELKQFHLEQVAEGSKLIENNLKSLQKLFEVLVALHYPDTNAPVIEPESLDSDTQLLPSVEEIPDPGLVVEPQEAVVADTVVTPDIVTEEDVPDTGLVVEPQEAAVADAIATSDTLTEEDIVQDASPFSELPASSVTEPTEYAQLLEEETDEEDDDDWDDSVLDLLESLPVTPPPTPETSDSDLRENLGWNDLVEEEPESEGRQLDSPENQVWESLTPEDFESPPALGEVNLEASSFQVDEDLRDFVEETSASDSEESESLANQGWEHLRREDFESPSTSEQQHIEASISQMDEDWGDFVEETAAFERGESDSLANQDWERLSREDFESPPTSEQQNLEGSISQMDEDWGDLVEDESASDPQASDSLANQDWERLSREDFESPPTSEQQNLEGSISQMDEDWGDLVEDEPESELDRPIPNLESLDLEDDEEWDDWVMEEPGPAIEAPIVDIESLDLGEDEDWGDLVEDSDPFSGVASLNEPPSILEGDEDWDDFTAEELKPSVASLGKDGDTDAGFDLSGTLDDFTFAESEANNLELNENPGSESSRDRDLPGKMPQATDAALPEESGTGVSDDHPDPLAGLQDEAEAKPKSTSKRVTPPPPPSRSQNQNN